MFFSARGFFFCNKDFFKSFFQVFFFLQTKFFFLQSKVRRNKIQKKIGNSFFEKMNKGFSVSFFDQKQMFFRSIIKLVFVSFFLELAVSFMSFFFALKVFLFKERFSFKKYFCLVPRDFAGAPVLLQCIRD